MTITETNIPQTFPAFVRTRVLTLISPQDATTSHIPADDAARAFFNELNVFLTREGQSPIDAAAYSTIPPNLADLLTDQLGIAALRRETTPFTHGNDVKPRVNSRERNQYEADLMRAISHYYSAAHHETLPPSDHFKLWKRVVTKHADGTVTTELKEVDRIDPKEHAIIAFNGVWGMHSYPDRTNGLINEAERLMGGKDVYLKPAKGKDVAIYAVSIPDRNRIHYAAEIPASNANPDGCTAGMDPKGYVSPMTRDFMTRVILPSIGLENTKPITLPEAKAALRQLNFLLFSYGSTLGREMRNVLAETLSQKGLQSDEIKKALAEVYALNINPVCRLDDAHPHGNFSSVYMVSKNDQAAAVRADYKQYVPDADKPNAKLPRLVPIGDHGLMVWDDTPVFIDTKDFKAKDKAGSDKPMEIFSAEAAKHLPHSAGTFANGHRLSLTTQYYAYVDQIFPNLDILKFHDPSHVQLTLRNAVGATELPADLSQTFEPPKADATNQTTRPTLSQTMQLAIEKFRNQLGTKEPAKA